MSKKFYASKEILGSSTLLVTVWDSKKNRDNYVDDTNATAIYRHEVINEADNGELPSMGGNAPTPFTKERWCIINSFEHQFDNGFIGVIQAADPSYCWVVEPFNK